MKVVLGKKPLFFPTKTVFSTPERQLHIKEIPKKKKALIFGSLKDIHHFTIKEAFQETKNNMDFVLKCQRQRMIFTSFLRALLKGIFLRKVRKMSVNCKTPLIKRYQSNIEQCDEKWFELFQTFKRIVNSTFPVQGRPYKIVNKLE